MIRVAIIVGSTRPGRIGEAVARWVHDIAAKRGDAEFETVDLKEIDLPPLDEPMPAAAGQYRHPHTKAWAEKMASFDAYVFVTPEYNHSVPGALKNAIDYLHAEWGNKAAGFVGYGVAGGVRAVEHLRLILSQVQIADVSAQVALSLFTEFPELGVFKPAAYQEDAVSAMLDQLVSWATALQPLRMGAGTQRAHRYSVDDMADLPVSRG